VSCHTTLMNPITDPFSETAPTLAVNANATAASLAAAKVLSIRVIGLGGAGGNAVAHMAKTDLRELHPVALHTSARILDTIQAPEKILLGADLTHGLGAGGDPSLARAAAEHDLDLLKNLCHGVDLLFLVTGLGGGTGTGIAPVLARVAKESGALVLGLATLPFDIEGARRRHQAQQGLAELKAAADAVICLPNQKIFRFVDEKTSVLESLKITNDLLAQGIRGIWQMLTRPSLIHVDFADLCAVLRDRHVESSFATAEAQGEGRAREIIEQLLASPLLEGGQALAKAEAVLVNLVGGPDLCMADVKRVMEELNRRLDNAQLIMGASIAEDWQGRVGLTLVASHRAGPEPRDAAPPVERLGSTPSIASLQVPTEIESRFLEPSQSECGASRFVPPPPPFSLDQAEQLLSRSPTGASRSGRAAVRRLQQADLPLEIVSKGRFQKSHPTIHRGEDLDVPTYVRRGIPLN
jgi:cell division protein FtsZ